MKDLIHPRFLSPTPSTWGVLFAVLMGLASMANLQASGRPLGQLVGETEGFASQAEALAEGHPDAYVFRNQARIAAKQARVTLQKGLVWQRRKKIEALHETALGALQAVEQRVLPRAPAPVAPSPIQYAPSPSQAPQPPPLPVPPTLPRAANQVTYPGDPLAPLNPIAIRELDKWRGDTQNYTIPQKEVYLQTLRSTYSARPRPGIENALARFQQDIELDKIRLQARHNATVPGLPTHSPK